MDITIIAKSVEHTLDPTRYFGIVLSKSLSIIHMVHWYVTDFNIHQILGDLYGTLDDLFDKLQEEIIGSSKLQSVVFPSFSPECLNLDDADQFKGDNCALIETYQKTSVKLTAILSSREFANYIDSVDSGINNTKEDILSALNKTSYLLSMIKMD
jgi:hypothetical protein